MGPWGDGLDPNHRLHMTVHMTVTILLILLLSFGLFLICFCQSFLRHSLSGCKAIANLFFWFTSVTLFLILPRPIFFVLAYYCHSLSGFAIANFFFFLLSSLSDFASANLFLFGFYSALSLHICLLVFFCVSFYNFADSWCSN